MLTQDWGVWLGASLIYFFAMQAIVQPISIALRVLIAGDALGLKPVDPSVTLTLVVVQLPVNILTTALGMVVLTGMTDMAYKRQEGYAISVADMFVGFKRFVPVFMACLLELMAILVGACLCLVPGLYAAGALAFGPMMALRQDLGASDALQSSYNTLKSQVWITVALLFLSFVCTMLGVLACCVGLIFLLPLQSIVVGINYYNFFPPAQAQPTPATGFTPYPRGTQPEGFTPAQPAPNPPSTPEVPEMPSIPNMPEIPNAPDFSDTGHTSGANPNAPSEPES